MHESENESEVTQSYPTLRDPMDCSLSGSSVHGICQARVLEWGVIVLKKSNTEKQGAEQWLLGWVGRWEE